ncbi:alpha/beta hydrolase [Streptomyces gamaensis]|uniref:Alpha/beta hydrolase n=1 Tax=Streptomyces gamaensis TaxID=1763542 RepID=A0ABW0Z903_9ACTN
MTYPPISDTRPDQRGHAPHGRRPRRGKRWLLVVACIAVLGLIAWPVMSYFEIPPFTDKGEAITFGKQQEDGKGGTPEKSGDPNVLMPTGAYPEQPTIETSVSDGTKVAVVTITGKKSGFKGKVWLWAPKEYDDPKYAKSGFPVMIALPGGAGFPKNYWMGQDLKLQSSMSQWIKEGKSLPFILAMPVLNPENHDKDKNDPMLGTYWDASDIPGQPKMGTWLTEDVPDLVRSNFRTQKSRDGWAFMGSSTGGFAGLKSVLQKPDQFKAVIASGPDVAPDSHLWKGHDAEKAANNPKLLAPKLIQSGHPDVYLAFQVGTKETSALPPIQDFVKQYTKGPIHTKLSIIQGGEHNAASYVPAMENGGLIQWISQHMQGPKPAS